MIYYIIKVAISATLIVAISEVSKKSSLIGGIIASIPLVSVLAMIWLYIETKDVVKISQFSTSVFWMVIPSLGLFIFLPLLLRMKINFYLALSLASGVTVLLYYLMIALLAKFGIRI
jgi:hypothetical protein